MGVVFLQNSHAEGSGAAVTQFLMFLSMWEALYQITSRAIGLTISRFPDQIVPTETTQSAGQACKTLAERGPSYAISFLHSAYVTKRGFGHLLALWNASNTDKLMIPGRSVVSRVRLDHLEVARTNILFVSYLVYDLVHIITQYPKLGGLDTGRSRPISLVSRSSLVATVSSLTALHSRPPCFVCNLFFHQRNLWHYGISFRMVDSRRNEHNILELEVVHAQIWTAGLCSSETNQQPFCLDVHCDAHRNLHLWRRAAFWPQHQ